MNKSTLREVMTILLMIVSITGVMSTLPFLIPYQILLTAQRKKIGYRLPIEHTVAVFIFVYYLAFVFIITEIPSVRDIFHNSFGIPFPRVSSFSPEINLIPFRWITEGIRPYIENILLFVPLGFLLPCVWKKYEVLSRTVLSGFALSLIIELSQMFDGRITDIDDLLMNTLGAFIGWSVFWLLKAKLTKFQSKFALQRSDIGKVPLLLREEARLCMVIACAGIFFFFPFLRALL